MAANAITSNAITLHNVPAISDISVLQSILATAQQASDGCCDLTGDDVKKIRSSILLIPYGLLAHGRVHFTMPGGCKLGKRPLTAFDDALRQAGVSLTFADGYKVFEVTDKPTARIILQQLSVTTTEALVTYLAFATHYDYPVTIHLCAVEPHVSDLIDYLRTAGARVEM